tara:strand:- start:1343 stop:1582 length:240 start_codon:yes stop_codon:yes gene_type:complete
MFKKFTKHPHEQGETYLAHMLSAWKIICVLKTLELKCAIHSVFPFLYTAAVSEKIGCLQKMTNRKVPDDEELYETYGGD